jgi:hypothetical protein
MVNFFEEFKQLALSLRDCTYVLAKRNQNCAAHQAAAYARRMGVGADWSTMYPYQNVTAIVFFIVIMNLPMN